MGEAQDIPERQVATDSVVGAVGASPRPDPTMKLLEALVKRIERLEASYSEGQKTREDQPLHDRREEMDRRSTREENPTGRLPQTSRNRLPVICRKCGKEGHYARGCAVRQPRASGNY